MNNVDLKEMVGGALQEQFAKSFEKVIENLRNPNTPFKNARQITIKMKFTQNESRDDVHCAVSVDEKLAPQAPLATAFSIGTDIRTGEVYAEEYGRHHIYGQISMDDIADQEESVDPVTGEIKVVDLRAAK